MPICCIFTSIRLAEEIGINNNIYKEIEFPFYNKGGVKINFADCVKSFEKYILFYKKLSKNISYKKFNRSYEGCLTFELISKKNQLVFPFLFYEIMENEMKIIPDLDIITFKSFVQKNFKEKEIQKIIIPMLYMKYYPRKIVSKFFARMYTEEASFFSEMNKALMKKEKNYDTYVKVMYEGLYIGSLNHSKDDILYHGSRMTRNEINNIRKSFEEWNKMKDKKLPKFLLYSRTFLSFTKIEAKIKRFLGKTNETFYGVVFLLKNNKDISNKYSSNADIEYLSKYPDKKEVIFFLIQHFVLKIYLSKNIKIKIVFLQN